MQARVILVVLAAAGHCLAMTQQGSASNKTRVAVLVPSNPFLHPRLKVILNDNLDMLLEGNPTLDMKVFVDSGPLEVLPEDERPLSKTSRLRNRMLDSIDLDLFDYLLWLDSDLVEIPADLVTTLIRANPTGVTAPLVLIEEPGPLGPNQFYDTTAFVLEGRANEQANDTNPYVKGRSIEMFPPYVPNKKPGQELVPMDGVGTCYCMPKRVFSEGGARFTDHPRLTEHWFAVPPMPSPKCLARSDMPSAGRSSKPRTTWSYP